MSSNRNHLLQEEGGTSRGPWESLLPLPQTRLQLNLESNDKNWVTRYTAEIHLSSIHWPTSIATTQPSRRLFPTPPMPRYTFTIASFPFHLIITLGENLSIEKGRPPKPSQLRNWGDILLARPPIYIVGLGRNRLFL